MPKRFLTVKKEIEMDEIGTKIIYDTSDFVKNITDQINRMELAKKSSDELADAVKKSIQDQVDSLESLGAAEKKQVNETKQVIQSKKDLLELRKKESSALREEVGNISILGKSMREWSQSFGRVNTIINTNIKILGKFKLALLGTGIGAIVVALGSMIAYLTKTQAGIDKVTKVTAQFGAAIRVIIDRFKKLGENLLNGNFFKKVGDRMVKFWKNPIKTIREDLKGLKDGFKEVKDEIAEEVKKTGELQNAKTKLRDLERQIRIETAEQRKEIKRLNLIAEDTTKTYEERLKAAKAAGAIERNVIKDQIKAEDERIRILSETMAMSDNLAAQEDELAEARIKRAELETASLEMQTTINNKLNTIMAERARVIAAMNQAYQDGYDAMMQQIEDFDYDHGLLGDSDKLAKEREVAIKALENQKEAMLELARQTGNSGDDIEDAYDELIKKTEEYYLKQRQVYKVAEIGKLDSVRPKIKIDPQPPDDTDLEKLFDAFQGIKGAIINNLGITPDEADLIISSAMNAFGQIANMYSEGINRRIEENEKYIESLNQQETELQASLERQLDLKERGIANDYDLVKQNLEETQKLEEAALKKSEQLKKKQAQIQLAQDVAKAGQSLITAAAGIMEANAGIPFVGVALGVTFVTAMIAAFARFKNQSKSLSRLYKGAANIGDYLGFVQKGGSDDTPGRGPGYHVTDHYGRDTGVRIGGNEMLLPQRAALMHEDKLLKLGKNPEDYDIIKRYSGIKDSFAIPVHYSARQQNKELEKVMGTFTDKIVKAIHNKPFAFVLTEDSKEVVFVKGNDTEYLQLKS